MDPHDLLDTPVDPLALFDALDRGWSSLAGREPDAAGLFADLLAVRPTDGFDTPRQHGMGGHAIRDDVPELGGHLRLRVGRPQGESTRAEDPVAPPCRRQSCLSCPDSVGDRSTIGIPLAAWIVHKPLSCVPPRRDMVGVPM
jgi:hypothetical protein